MHLALAALASLLLLNISISGALLIYAKDIQAWVSPAQWTLPSIETSALSILPLSKLVQKIESSSQGKIKFIQHEKLPENAWLVSLTNGKYLNINPYTGEVLLQHSYHDTLYGFIMSWHRWLLYTDTSGERPLKVWVSIASLIFIVEIFIGCALWLRPKHRLKRLKIKWQSKPKVLNYQLHTMLGVTSSIPLILIAFSGMAFHWQPATKQVVEWLSFSKVETTSFEQPLTAVKENYQLDHAYNAGRLALKGSEVFRVYLPQTSTEPLKLRLKMPSESHGYSWSWVNPYSGELLKTFDASKASVATQVWNFKYKFHIGEFIGWPIKVLWLLLSLLPAFFIATGSYLLIKRKNFSRIISK